LILSNTLTFPLIQEKAETSRNRQKQDDAKAASFKDPERTAL
jgi:hypothetical protein